MQYTLDAEGYISSVAFGSNIEDGIEYSGKTPSGYSSLNEWAEGDCIHSFYVGSDGNLAQDYARKSELETRQKQQAVDYTPVLRREIYETEEIVSNQYIRQTANGKVIALSDIRVASPKLKITNVPSGSGKVTVYTQGRNMMPCTSVGKVVSGVTFTKNASGSITVLGTATENIEYIIADGGSEVMFVLKGHESYHLSLGGIQCELRYFDGETTAQKYIGASGMIRLEEDVAVTQVVLKIPSGESINTTFYPQLEYGASFTEYNPHKIQKLEIDIGQQIAEKIYPEDTLYAKDTLYPGTTPKTVDYILIQDGKIFISVNQEEKLENVARLGLFGDYSTLYTDVDATLELEYSSNIIDVDSLEFLQGKATTTNRFKILDDGSIEAHNGYFSGTINATDGVFKGRIEADSGYFNGSISWGQISNADSYVTKITSNTVTTAYVNALQVKAGSVDAENILGTTITGKTISGGYINGSVINGGSITIGTNFYVTSAGNLTANSLNSSDATITGGKIGGFTIDSKGIRSGKVSVNDSASGVYIGTDGINVGYNSAFKVTSSGDVTIGTIGGLTLGNSAKLNFVGGTISVEDDGVYFGNDRSTHVKSGELKVGGSYNYYTTINQNKITFGSGSTAYLYHGSNALITMNSSSVTIGTTSSKVGFFGLSGNTKQKVAKISSTYSATASEVATKINALIDALNSYGLISNSSY